MCKPFFHEFLVIPPASSSAIMLHYSQQSLQTRGLNPDRPLAHINNRRGAGGAMFYLVMEAWKSRLLQGGLYPVLPLPVGREFQRPLVPQLYLGRMLLVWSGAQVVGWPGQTSHSFSCRRLLASHAGGYQLPLMRFILMQLIPHGSRSLWKGIWGSQGKSSRPQAYAPDQALKTSAQGEARAPACGGGDGGPKSDDWK